MQPWAWHQGGQALHELKRRHHDVGSAVAPGAFELQHHLHFMSWGQALPFASSQYSVGMVRPMRIEFPGAVYHVTSRGDRREPIFVDDEDRQGLLGVVAQALSRFDAEALSYCWMGNHYHFVLHTRQANLSLLMRHINGVYTQSFNRRHDKVGHLFQGRFKAILVDRDAYLLQVCRYVDLNPVRARLVRKPEA